MKNIYIAVFAVFVACVLLFIGAFVYLDKEGRKTYHYTVTLDGRNVGSIKINKFVTEDKLLYRSVSNVPFYSALPDSKTNITLDRKYNINTYSVKESGPGAAEIYYLEYNKNVLSFLAVYQSEFIHLNEIPMRAGTFIFKEDSPVTYLPMIENYNFRKGRAQSFSALIHFSNYLPPMKRFVILTSIRDEYLKIGSKKIKTECLIVKIKNYPSATIWISKADKSLIALEIPEQHLRITRTFSPMQFEAKGYFIEAKGYTIREAVFKSKSARLNGTLTVPQKEGKSPAVLLIWGSGPQDREYQGFFTSLADYLSRNGFCVLRFDKPGIGLSGGDYPSTAYSDELDDLNAAMEYLAGHSEVNPQKIFILGHGKGAFYATELASKWPSKGLILMAPQAYMGTTQADNQDLNSMASRLQWSNDYLRLATKARLETMDKVANAKRNWTVILGKRCFLKKMKEEMDVNPVDSIKKIQAPVLILQGKEDTATAQESAPLLDRTLEEGGNKDHSLIYFSYLGHFFGKRIADGIYKMHYEVDKEALETIKNWLNKNLIEVSTEVQVEVMPPDLKK